jgi:hypothetical protein
MTGRMELPIVKALEDPIYRAANPKVAAYVIIVMIFISLLFAFSIHELGICWKSISDWNRTTFDWDISCNYGNSLCNGCEQCRLLNVFSYDSNLFYS